MIRECEVKLCNSEVIVVLFDGKEIQMPRRDNISSSVYVKFDHGHYSLATEIEYKEMTKKKVNEKKGTSVHDNTLVMDNEEQGYSPLVIHSSLAMSLFFTKISEKPKM